jgi:hypothetical protein
MDRWPPSQSPTRTKRKRNRTARIPGSGARGGMACRLCVLRDLRLAVGIEGNPDRHQLNDQAHASVESLSQYSPHPSSGHPLPMPCIPSVPTGMGRGGQRCVAGGGCGWRDTPTQRSTLNAVRCSRWVLSGNTFDGRARGPGTGVIVQWGCTPGCTPPARDDENQIVAAGCCAIKERDSLIWAADSAPRVMESRSPRFWA